MRILNMETLDQRRKQQCLILLTFAWGSLLSRGAATFVGGRYFRRGLFLSYVYSKKFSSYIATIREVNSTEIDSLTLTTRKRAIRAPNSICNIFKTLNCIYLQWLSLPFKMPELENARMGTFRCFSEPTRFQDLLNSTRCETEKIHYWVT